MTMMLTLTTSHFIYLFGRLFIRTFVDSFFKWLIYLFISTYTCVSLITFQWSFMVLWRLDWRI